MSGPVPLRTIAKVRKRLLNPVVLSENSKKSPLLQLLALNEFALPLPTGVVKFEELRWTADRVPGPKSELNGPTVPVPDASAGVTISKENWLMMIWAGAENAQKAEPQSSASGVIFMSMRVGGWNSNNDNRLTRRWV